MSVIIKSPPKPQLVIHFLPHSAQSLWGIVPNHLAHDYKIKQLTARAFTRIQTENIETHLYHWGLLSCYILNKCIYIYLKKNMFSLDKSCHWDVHENLSIVYHIDGLVQEEKNSIANALELSHSCTNLSMCVQYVDQLFLWRPWYLWCRIYQIMSVLEFFLLIKPQIDLHQLYNMNTLFNWYQW